MKFTKKKLNQVKKEISRFNILLSINVNLMFMEVKNLILIVELTKTIPEPV
jgi:hypothetical protein